MYKARGKTKWKKISEAIRKTRMYIIKVLDKNLNIAINK